MTGDTYNILVCRCSLNKDTCSIKQCPHHKCHMPPSQYWISFKCENLFTQGECPFHEERLAESIAYRRMTWRAKLEKDKKRAERHRKKQELKRKQQSERDKQKHRGKCNG